MIEEKSVWSMMIIMHVEQVGTRIVDEKSVWLMMTMMQLGEVEVVEEKSLSG